MVDNEVFSWLNTVIDQLKTPSDIGGSFLFLILYHPRMRTSEKIRLFTIILLFLVAGVSFFRNETTVPADAAPLQLGTRTKTEHCVVRGPYPDPACTPGAVFPVTAEETCVSGYASSVRNVSVSLKKKVYQQYDLAYPQPKGAYEADHFIPLALGGNNDIANLFPEVGEPRPGFHEKDVVELFLRDEVCEGRMSLSAAQQAIVTDWVKVYEGINPFRRQEIKHRFSNWAD